MVRSVVHSRRAELRPVASEEIDEVHHVFSDPDVRRFLCDGIEHDREWAAGVIAKSRDLFSDRGVGLWSARGRGRPEIIGVAGFFEFSAPGRLELLYALLPAHWGAGLATEIAGRIIALGLENGVDPIRASVDAPNTASRRVLARLGFEEVGREPADPPRTKWEQVHFLRSRDAPGGGSA